MGYDRSITMFSPDGRLLQVEYAKKTVRQGSTAIGIVCKDGVVFVADKRVTSRLIVAESIEKMFKIDDHVGATASGIISDARLLVERAQLRAQQHRLTYDAPIPLLDIIKDLCDLSQMTTQSAGLRPFGVSLLIGGIDGKQPRLFLTDPTGIFFEYLAAVIGETEPDVEKILQKKYRLNMTLEEGMRMAVEALQEVLGKEFSLERLDIAYVSLKDKQYKRMENEKVRQLAK